MDANNNDVEVNIDEEEEEEDVLHPDGYGMRRVRRRTNWQQRATDAVRPLHVRNAWQLYDFTMDAVRRVHQYLSIMMSLLLWRQPVVYMAKFFYMLATHTLSMAYCSWHDFLDIVYYPQENREHERRFRQPVFRTINSLLTNRRAEELTGFNLAQLRKLKIHWRIPDRFVPEGRRTRFDGEESMIVFLYWMRHGHTFLHMSSYVFGGDPRQFTYMMRCMIKHLYGQFYHKISGDSMRYWIPFVGSFRRAIYERLSSDADDREILINGRYVGALPNLDPETFRIFGFLDDFGIRTCRPGETRRRDDNLQHDIQRAFYSGYFRYHGIKLQVVMLPNGMIGSVYCASLNQNDTGVMNMSGLSDYLVSLLQGMHLPPLNVFLPALYGDAIFPVLPCVVPRHRGTEATLSEDQIHWNYRLSSCRMIIEHLFGLHRQLFKLFAREELLKIFHYGENVHNMAVVSMFVLNCYLCMNESMCTMFNLRAISIEEYLPLNENLVEAPIVHDADLGTVFEFGNRRNNNR